MRPIKLKMSAFGPYMGEVSADLDLLGEKGLYLITGDTGAGKTTIFDAISFAIYGEPGGSSRKASMMRSKYADDNTPTLVDLTFLYREKEYRVVRNPEYERPSKRGEGTVKENASATLYMPDGKVISSRKEVNETLEEIMGINREQFSQIAMIAQGDFLRLLLSDTSNRQKIFRDIFRTSDYERLQEKLKAEAAALNAQWKEKSKSVDQYIDGIICDDDHPLSGVLLQRKEKEDRNIEEILETAEKILADDEELEKETGKEIEHVQELLSLKNKQLGTAGEITKAKAQLEKETEMLKTLKDERKKAAEELKKAVSLKEELPLISEQITRLEVELEKYREVEKRKAEITGLEKKEKGAEEKILTVKENIAAETDMFSALKEEIKKYENTESEKEKLEKRIEAIEEFEKSLNLLQKRQESYIHAQEKAAELKREYDLLYKEYLDQQAGILASELREGQPCPVCGSVEHPLKAEIKGEAISKENLDSMQIEKEKAEKEAAEKSRLAGEAKAKADLLKEQAGGEGNLSDEKKELEEGYRRVVADLKRKSLLERKIPETENHLNKEKEALGTLKEEYAGLKERIRKEKEEAEKLEKELRFSGLSEAEKEIEGLTQKKNGMEVIIKGAEDENEKTEKAVSRAEGTIDGLKKTLEGAPSYDLEKLKEEAADLSEKAGNLAQIKEKVIYRIKTNKAAISSAVKKKDEMGDLGEKLKMVSSLSDTANGKISGREKIMLETYVQMAFFERITQRASVRLMAMTGNQYELVRQQTADNLRSASGLELEVYDHYNGTRRHIRTLSGGESFKASLCLALGLADEVSLNAGGIKIDTMFIDEGFGTLDEESLNQAMSALSDLGSGDRLVGIISHVPELKNRIDRQIRVKKDRAGGSSISILV